MGKFTFARMRVWTFRIILGSYWGNIAVWIGPLYVSWVRSDSATGGE